MTINGTAFNSTTQEATESSLLYSIILGSMGGLAVLTNAPLLLVLLRRRAQTTPVFCARMTCLVGNLALADCLTGVAVILSVLNATKYHLMIVWTTIEASYFTLLLVSIERFVVLAYPLTWPFILSTNRTFLCIGFTWLVSIACGVAVHNYQLRVQFVLTIVFEVLVFTAITLHSIIFLNLQHRHRKFCERFSELSENRMKLMNPVDQNSATVVIFILVIILIVTAVPYQVLIQIIMGHFLGFVHLTHAQLMTAAKLYHYLYVLELINFTVNPIVYAWRIKRYREALQDTFISILNVRPSSLKFRFG